MTRSTWITRRRRQRLQDAETVAAVLSGGEAYPADVVRLTGLTPRRAYRALTLLHRQRRVTWRRADEPFPRRRVYRLVPMGGHGRI